MITKVFMSLKCLDGGSTIMFIDTIKPGNATHMVLRTRLPMLTKESARIQIIIVVYIQSCVKIASHTVKMSNPYPRASPPPRSERSPQWAYIHLQWIRT